MYARIQSAGRTDIGRHRETNQDHYLVADLSKSMQIHSTSLNLESKSRLFGSPQGHLYMVADGMGGHLSGNRASAMAIDFIINHLLNYLHWFARLDRDDETKFMSDLKKMVRAAHAAIEADAKRKVDYRGMGTTFTMAYVVWPLAYIMHVGDTRCYLYRRGELRQLTRDHTMASQMAEQGGLLQSDLEASPWNNVLWNALGGGASEVEPDVFKHRLEVDDCLLLCSDGLNKYLKAHEIGNILDVEHDPASACRALIDLANYRGGSDNITTIVARCDKPDITPAKTKVAAQVTLERLLCDLSGYEVGEVVADTASQPTPIAGMTATADLSESPTPTDTANGMSRAHDTDPAG